jgi:hypothetical protein
MFIIRRMLLQKLFDPIVLWLHCNGEHQLHNSFTIRLMSKPPAQGSDPVHGWVSSLHVLHFNLLLLLRLVSSWVDFTTKAHFPGPLIVRERCEII